MKKKIDLRFGILILFVAFAALTRLLPHPPNFTAIGSIGLFGAAYFSRKYLAFLVPFGALWVSDLLLNNLVYARMYPEFYNGFSWFGNLWVYASFVLIISLGLVILKTVKPLNLFFSTITASILFFLITNFGVWAGGITYPMTAEGLGASYVAAIPFFWNTLAGNLFFTAVLFGAYESVNKYYLSASVD